MELDNVEKLFRFAARAQKRLGIKNGGGTNWYAKVDSGETHHYLLNGVKSPEEIEEDILAAFHWLWSIKDNVKDYCEKKGAASRWIEAEISADPYLCVCGDIANRTKHPSLKKGSRSNKYPVLGKLKYQIPQEALGSITVGAFDVTTDIAKPELVSLKMPILSSDGKYLGDAFKYIEYGLKAWERIIDRAEKAV
ncbi:MAG: hypothetical protein WD823_00135 [Sulfuricaulis sp.]|uniref:hypothetical protein n=1 Tax=Sulfuricaulis sp. TaxID=2003553 RepID=UPI0034A31514